jgi:hypothetical protein
MSTNMAVNALKLHLLTILMLGCCASSALAANDNASRPFVGSWALTIPGGALWSDPFRPGPICLQGDHSQIEYRNIILRPVIK